MRGQLSDKRGFDEDSDAALVLDRLADISNRAKRVKRSPVKNIEELHNLVTFSQYYNDEFHSESDSDLDDGATVKDIDSEDSPPIELEIQEIRVTKSKKNAKKSKSKKNDRPAATDRTAHRVHELSKTLSMVLSDLNIDVMENRSVETIRDDTEGAMDELTATLDACRHLTQSIRPTRGELAPVVKPGLSQLWETARKVGRQEARVNLACWRSAADELRLVLQDTLASCPNSEHTPLFERCLDFMASVSLCNLLRDKSPDIQDMTVHESTKQLCRSIHQYDVERMESLASQVRAQIQGIQRQATQGTLLRAISPLDHSTVVPSPPPSPPPVKKRASFHGTAEPGCAVCGVDAGDVMLCDNGCGKQYHAACLDLDGPPEEGSWYCPECMESLGLSGDGQVFMCAALHCKRVSVTRYCAVHSCRFKGCNFRLRGRGYCRRHDTHQKRTMAQD
ncbi:unnamed protein product [Aphanomyces euteiches]